MANQTFQSMPERLEKIFYTGALSDILDEMGFHDQVLPKQIQVLEPGKTLAGEGSGPLCARSDSATERFWLRLVRVRERVSPRAWGLIQTLSKRRLRPDAPGRISE